MSVSRGRARAVGSASVGAGGTVGGPVARAMREGARAGAGRASLTGVRFSPSGLPSRTFLERMALAADVTALAVPAMKLIHEKLSSLSDARLTPAMMGTSER